MINHEEKAHELFKQGYNCAQSVFAAFCDVTGMDFETAIKLTSGFGAGMGLPNMKKYTDNMQIDTVLGVGTTISLRVDLH